LKVAVRRSALLGSAGIVRRCLHLAGHALALAISAYVFWKFNGQFLHNAFGYDEQFFVWGGWSITKGLVPYRDFLEFKPPLVFITHALALRLFGFRPGGYRYLFAFFPLVSILAIQLSMLSRKIDRTVSAILVAGMIWLFVNPSYHDTALSDSESIGLSYYLLGTACLMAETRFRRIADTVGGVLLTCCVLSKEPFLPCVVTTWLSVLLLEGGGGVRARARRYVTYTWLGIAIVVLGLCIYMVPTGALKAYLAMSARYTNVYRDPMQSYCVVLGRFHPTTPMHDLFVQWTQAMAEFVNIPTLGFLVPFFVASCVFIARRSILLFFTSGLGVAAALWAVTASNCQWPHYYNMAMSGLFFFLVVGLDSMTGALRGCPRSMRVWVRAMLATVVALQIGPPLESERAANYEFVSLADNLPVVRFVPGLLDIIAQYTSEADRIFTIGAPGLYVVTNRISAMRESNWTDEIIGIYPGATDAEKLKPLYDELAQRMPKVVVLDPQFAPRMVRHMANVVTPFLTNFHYVRLNTYVFLRP
jgi:hypothetical protein